MRDLLDSLQVNINKEDYQSHSGSGEVNKVAIANNTNFDCTDPSIMADIQLELVVKVFISYKLIHMPLSITTTDIMVFLSHFYH